MNIVWIVADTFRRDHLGAYGNDLIRTPVLDALAAGGVRFDSHYAAAFPTMPTRADHFTGRWTMSFMAWMPFDDDVTTLGNILSDNGVHTAAVVDTPFYWRHGFNYDRGFQTYFTVQGQEGSPTRVQRIGHHESRDVVAWWRKESDRNVAQTMIRAGDWLERHYKERFFLYVDTWDPHEPWDAPPYYTELYMPEYDGEVVQPLYGRWQDQPGFTEAKVEEGPRHLPRRGDDGRHLGRLPASQDREHGAGRRHSGHIHDRPRLLLRRARRPVRQDELRHAARRAASTSTATRTRSGTTARCSRRSCACRC